MLEQLKKLINDIMPELDVTNVTENTRLVEDLHFDSLAVMMLAMNIEDTYNITFDGPMNFRTVKDVMDFVNAAKK